MARFCTQCGVSNLDAARFCEECGTPLKSLAVPSSSTGSASTADVAWPAAPRSKRKLLISAGAVVALLAIGTGVTIWLGPEAPSEASFKRAVNQYLSDNASARESLLCVSNMRYQGEIIRVSQFDGYTKRWMDTLAQSGVYGAAQEERSGSGYFIQRQFVYTLTDSGKPWVKNNRLCLGEGLTVKTVSGFDQVQKNGDKSIALASAQLEIQGEAAWLKNTPQRADILQKTNKADLRLNVPLTLIDGKWKVAADTASLRQADFNLFGRHSARTEQNDGLMSKFKRWFSFGGHPLVGKWRDDTGMVNFEFTRNQVIHDGETVKARFETEGDTIKVWLEDAQESQLNVRMQGNDVAFINLGLVRLKLSRVN